MAPEKDSNLSNDQGNKNAPDVPPEVLIDTPPNSLHETSTDVDGRPELLRIEFVPPNNRYKCMEVILLTRQVLVQEQRCNTNWCPRHRALFVQRKQPVSANRLR